MPTQDEWADLGRRPAPVAEPSNYPQATREGLLERYVGSGTRTAAGAEIRLDWAGGFERWALRDGRTRYELVEHTRRDT